MQFSAEHRFPGPTADVVALMVDPAFEASVALPDLGAATVLGHDATGAQRLLRLRYEYIGQLDPIARRLLAGQDLALVQEVRLDPSSGRGRLTISAEADPDRLHGSADVTVADDGVDACVRRLRGEFVVKVPLMGRTVERRLLPGILGRLDIEAAALTARLRADGNGSGGSP
jgi:Protein of unknown function (DUF2505)